MIATVSRFVKNLGFNIIADFSIKIVNAGLILLISQFLGVKSLGSYSLAHTYYTFGLLFSLWGFSSILTREVVKNKKDYNKYLSNFSFVRLLLSIISIIVINLIVKNFDYSIETKNAILIISFAILASTLLNLFQSLFMAFEELKYYSITAIIISALRIFFSFLILYYGGTIITVAVFYTITEFLYLVLILLLAQRYFKELHLQINLGFCYQNIIIGFPLFIIAILVVIDNRIDILLISFFFNETFVGFYTAANTIIGGISLLSEGLRNAIFPVFARFQKVYPGRLPEVLLILGKYVLIITTPITIGVFMFAEPIVYFLFNSTYDISVVLLKVLIWVFIGYSLSVISIRLLIVHKKETQIVFALFISSLLTLILNIFLIPQLGIISIAIARLISSYTLLIILAYFLYQLGYKLIGFKTLIKILLAGSCHFIITILLRDINIVIAYFLGFLIFIIFVCLLKVVQKKELALWRMVFSRFIK
jgi:O-antigen/teichoic acid export membrane protein